MQNVFDRLRDYFEQLSLRLSAERGTSSIFPNRSDAGTSREDVLKQFLEEHIPSCCSVVKGGFIFNLDGAESKQIDLIVLNDLAVRFEHHSCAFSCIEGTIAAISVKTSLDGNQLDDALLNIASIPKMPDGAGNLINPLIKGRESFQDYPMKIIFAFDGPEMVNVTERLKIFFAAHPEIPSNRKPDLIIVNRKYVITHIGPNPRMQRDGKEISPGSFHGALGTNVGGYALVNMLQLVQRAAFVGTHVIANFHEYHNKIDY